MDIGTLAMLLPARLWQSELLCSSDFEGRPMPSDHQGMSPCASLRRAPPESNASLLALSRLASTVRSPLVESRHRAKCDYKLVVHGSQVGWTLVSDLARLGLCRGFRTQCSVSGFGPQWGGGAWRCAYKPIRVEQLIIVKCRVVPSPESQGLASASNGGSKFEVATKPCELPPALLPSMIARANPS